MLRLGAAQLLLAQEHGWNRAWVQSCSFGLYESSRSPSNANAASRQGLASLSDTLLPLNPS